VEPPQPSDEGRAYADFLFGTCVRGGTSYLLIARAALERVRPCRARPRWANARLDARFSSRVQVILRSRCLKGDGIFRFRRNNVAPDMYQADLARLSLASDPRPEKTAKRCHFGSIDFGRMAFAWRRRFSRRTTIPPPHRYNRDRRIKATDRNRAIARTGQTHGNRNSEMV
jgi:hypothetical protein